MWEWAAHNPCSAKLPPPGKWSTKISANKAAMGGRLWGGKLSPWHVPGTRVCLDRRLLTPLSFSLQPKNRDPNLLSEEFLKILMSRPV